VELSEIDGPVVYLKLQGACGSCPSSMTTMTMGIRRRLMEKIPVDAHPAMIVCIVRRNLKQSIHVYATTAECTSYRWFAARKALCLEGF